MTKKAVLALMRHGESDAGHAKRFAGWADVPLSAEGRRQARAAAAALADSGHRFQVCYTSLLVRARDTLALVLDALGEHDAPVSADWHLNERHYGALQGRLRQDVVREFGDAAVVAWRRDYRARPPALARDDERHPCHDPRYAAVPADELPATESLEDAALRVVPWWETQIAPRLAAGDNVLVVAHTASLRGLTRIIESLDDATTAAFRVATCSPVLYEFDADLVPGQKTELALDASGRWRRLRSRLKPTRLLPWM